MNREEAKAKVAKLMAMGNDKRANENEAEAALRQAAWLMRQHDIEQGELEQATGQRQAFSWSTVNVPLDPTRYSKQCTAWVGMLAVGVTRLTDTLADYHEVADYGVCIRLRGEVMDVAYAVHLVKHLRDTVRSMSGKYPGTRKQREDYRRGMVSRLVQRMTELKAQTTAQTVVEAQTDASTATALVIVNRKAIERAEQFGTQKTRSTGSRRMSPDAHGAGVRDGNKVGFGRPMTGPASQRALGT